MVVNMMVIDFFVGVGGFFEGVCMVGVMVVWVVNYWLFVVQYYEVNYLIIWYQC